MTFVFDQSSLEETARQFHESLGHFRVFAFSGELGAGKTTFIAAICKAAGVKDTVSSPTYSIIQEYVTEGGATIYHIDLYRLEDEEEAAAAGVEDCLLSNQMCFVEWPARALDLFPAETVFGTLSILPGDVRLLQVKIPETS